MKNFVEMFSFLNYCKLGFTVGECMVVINLLLKAIQVKISWISSVEDISNHRRKLEIVN